MWWSYCRLFCLSVCLSVCTMTSSYCRLQGWLIQTQVSCLMCNSRQSTCCSFHDETMNAVAESWRLLVQFRDYLALAPGPWPIYFISLEIDAEKCNFYFSFCSAVQRLFGSGWRCSWQCARSQGHRPQNCNAADPAVWWPWQHHGTRTWAQLAGTPPTTQIANNFWKQ